MTPASGTRRLFLALWPDAELRTAIEVRRDALGALSKRVVPVHNLHATLAFLGNQPAERLDAIAAAAGEVQRSACPFSLRLDRFGWFARARVVWLGGAAVDAGRRLASDLRDAMAALGIELDGRPWRPHVTLFRNVAERPAFPDPEPLSWAADSFALIESIPGRPYQVLRTWPLE